MIWYICFVLAVILIGVMAKLALAKSLGRLRIVYVMLGCLAMTYILYIPPFFTLYDLSAALFGGFINVLQVISLDADHLQFYDLIRHEIPIRVFSELYYVLLALIHVLLPAVSALTAATLVIQCLSELQLKRIVRQQKKTLYVFSQVTDEAIVLARDIRKNDKKGDILFLDGGNDTELLELRRELRGCVLNEKMENLRFTAKTRSIHYYCISDNEENNLNDALALVSFLTDTDRRSQQNSHVFLFSTDPTAELILDSLDKGLVDIRIVDKQKMLAYRLLQDHPLPKYAVDGEIRVLLCGFSPMNQAFLKAAVWCGQLDGYSLAFSVVGQDLENAAADFRAEHPGLFTDRYRIDFFSYRNKAGFYHILENDLRRADYIVVAEDGCDRTIDSAVLLRRHFYQTDPHFAAAPPIFAYIENEQKAEAVRALKTAEAKPERRMSYDIRPFGMTATVYSFKNLTDSELEALSKNVHLVYEDIFSDGPIDADGALERYNLFEVNKSSNRANALHIRYKLLMLGLDYTDDPDAQEVELSAYLSEEALKRLTVAEHDRWMAFLESEGWVGATLEQADAYKRSGVSKGRHNCPLLRMHPYICAFDELKERSDGLGLPDSTVYDRELIARIPDILHDKWGVSGKIYKIVRAPAAFGGMSAECADEAR